MKKLIVFLGSALISLRPSVRDFYSRVKKKLIEGPASLVGTGISIHAKFDLVENNGADFSCNISTGLGIEVDINVIVLIRSSINVIQTQDVCVWLYF